MGRWNVRRIGLVGVVVAMMAGALHAQGPITQMDLSTLGWGYVSQPVAIETDGNPATEEWLVGVLFTARKRVVAVRPGGMCAGAWFEVGAEWTLTTRGGRSVYTRLLWPVFEVMTIQTPVCP